MRTKEKTRWIAPLLLLGVMASSVAQAEPGKERGKYLNRSIYMPVEFSLCEHLGDAIFYENDRPIAAMPAERMFQFTYYPDLEMMLPELVPIRVEGEYKEDHEPFVAKLAVTVDGIHTARTFRSAETEKQLERQLHKIDVRLQTQALRLTCKRFCKRAPAVASNPNSATASHDDP